MNESNNFTYEIKEHLATVSEKNGYTLELNLISFRGFPAKLDLRRWNRTNDTMQKGVTLTDDEARGVLTALEQYLKRDG